MQPLPKDSNQIDRTTADGGLGTVPPNTVTVPTDSANVPEEVLVAAARLGDVCAFGELIERHRSVCLKRAMLMMRNRSDAEDEVQNAFWKAFQRLDQFRGEGTFGAWLSRIVENQCLMRIREERNLRFVYLDESTESNVRIELVGQVADPEDECGLDEVVSLLRKEISRIPPLLRKVMLLRDLDQLSMDEVALQLGLSIPAESPCHEALRTQRSGHLDPNGPVFSGSIYSGELTARETVRSISIHAHCSGCRKEKKMKEF